MAQFTVNTDQGDFIYETDGCALRGPDGELVDLSAFGYTQYLLGVPTDNGQEQFSSAAPMLGKVQPRILKIQLGLGCNYSCSYCSQSGQVEDKTSRADAQEFLDGLDSWLTDPPHKIEFWGGEPLLYWKKIKMLAPTLREKFPLARLSIVTNGTLLTLERAHWMHELGFSIAVSHDGPGQARRGEDPFAKSDWSEVIRAVADLFGERFSFNTVITPGNHDLFSIANWFWERMGREVKVNVEDVVTDYVGAAWTERELSALERSMHDQVASGLAFAFPRIAWSAQQFVESLVVGKPLAGSQQVCGMDRKDQLAVDLKGTVLTCQNVGAGSGHAIGTVDRLEDVKLAAHPWPTRKNCSVCPVVHLCYGSCMLLADNTPEFKASCAASYHYNMGILSGIIQRITGATMRTVRGRTPGKFIPIRMVA